MASVEQAACNALATWLTSKLTGVEVRARWPDDDTNLPELAVTVIVSGAPVDEWTDPRVAAQEDIHAALPAPLDIDTTAIVDAPTANAALNTLRTRFIAHLSDVTAHAAADVTNTPTAPAVVDMTSVVQGSALANDLRTKLRAHEVLLGPHVVADTLNAPTASAATDLATLIALTRNLVEKLGAHFAARLYTWMVGARVVPVQLDLWATHEAARDELIADVEQQLRAGLEESAGDAIFDAPAPVSLGVAVALSAEDGWPGDHRAVFEFDDLSRDPSEPQAKEWRATYRGRLDVPMLVKRQSARLGRARVPITIDGIAGPSVTTTWAAGDPGYSESISG